MKKIKAFFSKSLYLELWLSIILGLAIWGGSYLLLQELNYQFSFSKLITVDYASAKVEASVADLQKYVNKNKLSSSDQKKIQQWANRNPMMFFCLEKDGALIYNFLDDYEESIVYDGDDYTAITEAYFKAPEAYTYTVSLTDGDVTMHIIEDFEYDLYNIIQNLNFFIGAILAIITITILIRKKIRYINQVTSGINILEGGDLEYDIPVKGNDEIAHVAESLNSMRVALSNQMENEKKALQANNSLVTALSHDLRTPLTTQMGYLEILKEHHYKSEEELDKYIGTALDTCHQIKEMSDRLFEYFLAFDPNPKRPDEALEQVNGMELFMQIISELTPPLMEQGFNFEVNENVEPFDIKVNTDDILRIFNNVFTNIDKYADEAEPVKIDIKKEDDNVILSFENTIRNVPRKNESAKIGLISISSLMKRQGGESKTFTIGDTFRLELWFISAGHCSI
jgi:signal transduction histidine kinase